MKMKKNTPRKDHNKRHPAPAEHGVRAKKHLGQHFLTDQNIAQKIVAALGAQPPLATNAPEAEHEQRAMCDSKIGRAQETGHRSEAERKHGRAQEAERAQETGHRPEAERELKTVCEPVQSPTPADVLEVGPGVGVLTQYLIQRDDIRLYAAEIDTESVEYLRTNFSALGDRLIEGDFLQMNLAEAFPDGVRIIGNFPYNISSQIFFKVIENRDLVPEVVGMIQREVAVRIAEPPGSREYGILSVLLQAWYDIEYLFTVNEGVFNPPPKVKSAVIRLRRNGVQSLGCDERLFVRVVKASFGQRRKMLRNSLKAVFGSMGGEEHRFFPTRAEQLAVADFVELTNWIAERI